MESLGIFKLHPTVMNPSLATANSACVDVYAFIQNKEIAVYDRYNNKSTIKTDENSVSIRIGPKERILVPTGIILDIPKHFSVRMHPRSGLAIKKGLALVNCEGVIDCDYVEELMTAVFIAQSNAITGTTIYVDGGQHLMPSSRDVMFKTK